MPARFFNFASLFNIPKSQKSTRCNHSRGRSLRGVESLERREMMTAVPAYSSFAGAPVTIYLDFDGHHEDSWGETYYQGPDAQFWNDVNTPKFSLDSDPNFSAAELQMIHQIYKCVAEDFAPFNINVTTVKPSDMSHTLRVAIGGSSDDWYKLDEAGGIAMPDSFSNSNYVNTVFVFSDEFSTARTMADCASQEIGHSFGLQHQSIWDSYSGEVIEEYDPGTLESAPIMGVPYDSLRSIWWRNEHAENGWLDLDDMHLMTIGEKNFFGYRPDDHGSTAQTATLITNINGSTNGVITMNGTSTDTTNDRDAFIVTLPSNSVMKHWVVSVEVDGYSANLDAKLQVYKFTGPVGKNGQYLNPPQFVGMADPGDDLGAMFDLGGGGAFMIVVSSHGDYGDLGQYTVRFSNDNIPLVNTNPVSLPPIIDVICDPLKPVALPGGVLGQNVVTTSQLNLNTLTMAAKPGKTLVTDSLHTATSAAKQTPTTFNALDEAFASFGQKLTTF